MKRTWHHSITRRRRGFVFALAAHWYDGRHLGITGWDATIGLGVVSLHFGTRKRPS